MASESMINIRDIAKKYDIDPDKFALWAVNEQKTIKVSFFNDIKASEVTTLLDLYKAAHPNTQIGADPLSGKVCAICHGFDDMGLFARVVFQDQIICKNCFNKSFPLVYNCRAQELIGITNEYTFEEYKAKFNDFIRSIEIADNFKSTYNAEPIALFNDDTKQMLFYTEITNNDAKRKGSSVVIQYDQIIDYALLEDDMTVADAQSALAGAIIAGTTGAVLATNTVKNNLCTKLQLKISTKGIDTPAFYCNIINGQIRKDSPTYNNAYTITQNAIAKLQQIISAQDTSKTPSVISSADEIRKYKSLLDDGIISEEEFNAKKKQLLGL